MTFVHLHVHSEYSLLDSTCRIDQLVAQAQRFGQKAIALTDRNVMYGVIPFYRACMRSGLHPLIGMEVSLELATEQKTVHSKASDDFPTILLLAQNNLGYQNLVKLSSTIQCSGRSCAPLPVIEKYSDGVLVLSGGADGPIDRLLAKENDAYAREAVEALLSVFGNRFFIEIQRAEHHQPIERQLRALARHYALTLVATNSIHYLSQEDARAHACLACIKNGTTLKERPVFDHEFDFKSTEEMSRKFADLPEAVAETGRIAELCHVSFEFGNARYPSFPLPEGETSRQVLHEQCIKGMNERYSVITLQIQDRLKYELSIIDKMGFNDYFLIVADLVAYARKSGYMPGPGRGSAAGSLVAYVLKITEVDPVKYHLLFERFLNPERITMPDIDLDFPDIDRDKMIEYAYKKYGRAHVAQIITFGTLAAKAAIRDVGRVLESDPQLVDRMARLIPALPKRTLDQALKESDKLRNLVNASKEAAELVALARKIEGLPRHTSIHAAGVIFSDRPLTDLVPIQLGHDSIPVTQYPMDILESLGLLKIDFLGLRNLTFMREVVQRTPEFNHNSITLETVPLDDPETYRLLGSGETMGIFQMESEGMRQVLRKLQPTEFEDIVAVLSLYRPGPVQFIDRYVRCKHGEEKVTYPHPDLEPILKQTYGVLVYQEQIMQIAVRIAGYSLGQADILRRAVAKKKRALLEQQKKSFIAGCVRNRHSEESASEIFDLIVRFANYGFNRSHAVAYSFISYRLAFLKAHFPQAFFAAHLTAIINNTDKLEATLRELHSRNIPLFPPSINESERGFEPSDRGIRFGLAAIKNVGVGAADALVSEREKNGPYTSLYDFCRRIPSRKVNRKAIEAMIFAGAFDLFDVERSSLLATLDRAMSFGEEEQKMAGGQTTLLPAEHDQDDYAEVPPLSRQERMHYEKMVLGFYLSAHPVSEFRAHLPRGFTTVSEAIKMSDGGVAVLLVMSEQIKRIRTKKGQPMAFFSASDETGVIDTVCFPDTYQMVDHLLLEGQLLVIRAKRANGKGGDTPQLVLIRVMLLKDYLSRNQMVLFLKIDRAHHHPEMLEQVKSALMQSPGRHRVFLYYELSKETVALGPKYSVHLDEAFISSLRSLLGTHNVTTTSERMR
ncbi:DNA polymerase III subunit alpha [Sporolactobacillus sp. CPB3-1]|uniref:DNA-directed DNA polymerase n=1 Tax=Sporolactobacillus mangiferae TaxID=2940498 RepID=A0ABT0M6Z8_9BACL|nr:DNA polymerase III subunit alpha [Sporolactobacillus mangiferae]MCL1630616.1 DNA polymerase III subunit alpha [Sporolactobacillus mangiferae]